MIVQNTRAVHFLCDLWPNPGTGKCYEILCIMLHLTRLLQYPFILITKYFLPDDNDVDIRQKGSFCQKDNNFCLF